MSFPKPNVTYVPIPHTNFGKARKSNITQISEHHIVGDAHHAIAKAKGNGSEFSATFVIAMDGTIYQLVAEHDTPYTDNAHQSNARSITIEHAGGHKNYPYTESMVQASIRLHAYLFSKYGNLKPVRHRDIPEIKADPNKATACSGDLDVDRIVKSAKNIIAKGNTVPNEQDVKEYFGVWEKRQPTNTELKVFTGQIWRSLTDVLLRNERNRRRKEVSDLHAALKHMREQADELEQRPTKTKFAELQQNLLNCEANLEDAKKDLDTVQSQQTENEQSVKSFIQKIAEFIKRIRPA